MRRTLWRDALHQCRAPHSTRPPASDTRTSHPPHCWSRCHSTARSGRDKAGSIRCCSEGHCWPPLNCPVGAARVVEAVWARPAGCGGCAEGAPRCRRGSAAGCPIPRCRAARTPAAAAGARPRCRLWDSNIKGVDTTAPRDHPYPHGHCCEGASKGEPSVRHHALGTMDTDATRGEREEHGPIAPPLRHLPPCILSTAVDQRAAGLTWGVRHEGRLASYTLRPAHGGPSRQLCVPRTNRYLVGGVGVFHRVVRRSHLILRLLGHPYWPVLAVSLSATQPLLPSPPPPAPPPPPNSG